jgi:non-lysosomal glucosylceramidase
MADPQKSTPHVGQDQRSSRPRQPGAGCCTPVTRRTFVKLAGLGAASTAFPVMAGPFSLQDVADHFVPADKKLQKEWVDSLYDPKATDLPYTGQALATIAMPVGGICAGQVYLAGDGRLGHWDIFNERIFTGYGRNNYQLGRSPEYPLDQGFAIEVKSDGKTIRKRLDASGFGPEIAFSGRYPVGRVAYRHADLFEVALEAFSPFIPLNAADSALPATLMQYTVANLSAAPIEVRLAGWLENGVCLKSRTAYDGRLVNRALRADGLAMVVSSAEASKTPAEPRESIVIADFEGGDYGQWTVEGEAFGKGPARGTLPSQQEVSGFAGKGLVNTYLGKDGPHGKLTSPEFTIERRFLNFLIGGGNHKGKTCINLLVDGQVVRTATGGNNEKLAWQHWSVRELEGKKARIEIVDHESGPWGHINIDQIEQGDQIRAGAGGRLAEQADFGTMALAVLADGGETFVAASLGEGEAADAALAAPPRESVAEQPFDKRLVGAVGRSLSLEPGGRATVTFVVAWHFPNRPERGHFYATRFNDAGAVARYIAENKVRLVGQTLLWHDTCYDSTLPAWLLDRLFSTASTLATGTCQWWANGRFWAWEGVGCCHGTCTHVWNYEHTMARLFPELERSVRQMQDFNPEAGFDEATGMVRFRGEGWTMWAGDGQAGTVLKAYREHLVSPDNAFLERNWPRIRKTLEFLINEDGNADGLLEGSQHNTYDINFFGANTMVGSLYLAALRAAEEMARELDDQEFAVKCRTIFESGKKLTIERLFNGEYFVQDVDLERHPKDQYGEGCLSDHLFGQGWAHQVGLGHIYPKETVLQALQSIWKYNWAPDIAAQNQAHPPERWFVQPGEGGLFTCTWPKSSHLAQGVRYRDEVWTGIEYQVAGNMAYDGMVTEALAICRAIHDRYHPSKRNPWNEVECGDHYARGMASHGVFLALCGFEYHGPKGHLGFAPRIRPDQFRAAFTAAEGWGALSQERSGGKQVSTIEVKWGRLRLNSVALELPDGTVRKVAAALNGAPLAARTEQEGARLVVTLAKEAVLEEGARLEITVS